MVPPLFSALRLCRPERIGSPKSVRRSASRQAHPRSAKAGFTLLEVMVAMGILGLGLTVILSSQAGLYQSTRRVQNEAFAGNLLRCRMSEIEVELLKEGFSLIDQTDSGECCEDEDEPGFSCEWKIETVELPPENVFDETATDSAELEGLGESDFGADLDTSIAQGNTDPFSAMSQISGSGLQGTADVGSALAGATGGPGGIIQMALGMVYPTLKPMLEASIRKVTVSVVWNEGKKDRDFTVVQYMTDPRQGGLNPNAPEIPEELLNAASGQSSASGSSTERSGATQ